MEVSFRFNWKGHQAITGVKTRRGSFGSATARLKDGRLEFSWSNTRQDARVRRKRSVGHIFPFFFKGKSFSIFPFNLHSQSVQKSMVPLERGMKTKVSRIVANSSIFT